MKVEFSVFSNHRAGALMREWTDEQRALRAGFAGDFAAWGEDHVRRDQESEFPGDQWKLVGDSGLLRLPFGPEWGGLGRDLLTTMYVLEGLGYGCRDGGLNFSVSTHMVSAGVPIQRYGSDRLKDRYLRRICEAAGIGAHAITERHGGSDAAAMRTTAVADGDDYVLNGEKCFVSNGPVADIFLVYARTTPGTGTFGITPFVVEADTPGLTIGRPIDTTGLRTSPFCNLTFDDCVVPASNMIGHRGQGFLVLDYVMKWEVLCTYAITLGAMQHRLDRCVQYARSRQRFGARTAHGRMIADKVVRMKIDVETSRKWVYDTADWFLAGADVATEIAITKLLVGEGNLKSAADAVQIFGGYGRSGSAEGRSGSVDSRSGSADGRFGSADGRSVGGRFVDHGLEKDLRDAGDAAVHPETSEAQRDEIARLLGVSRTGRWAR